MTAEGALKGVFLIAFGGLTGWIFSECAKENIQERSLTPKVTDLAIMTLGLLGVIFAKGGWQFFSAGLAGIGFGRLLIQFEAGELESEGSQCPLRFLFRTS